MGTKTPAVLKFSSKGATTDCVETPVNCPHCGQKWRLRRRLRRQPFILLSFSSSKKLQKAQETQSYQRFQHVGHTDFNTSGTNGPRSLSRAKVVHTRLSEKNRTQRLTRRNTGLPDGAAITTLDTYCTFTNIPGPGVRTAYFAALGSWPGGALEERRKPSGQRCAYACRCPEASRPRWAA